MRISAVRSRRPCLPRLRNSLRLLRKLRNSTSWPRRSSPLSPLPSQKSREGTDQPAVDGGRHAKANNNTAQVTHRARTIRPDLACAQLLSKGPLGETTANVLDSNFGF